MNYKSLVFTLIITSISLFSFSQVLVKGVVIDKEEGEPLIGATVVEVGTTNGGVTDFDGKFSLEVKSVESQIEISFIDLKSQIINVSEYHGDTIYMEFDKSKFFHQHFKYFPFFSFGVSFLVPNLYSGIYTRFSFPLKTHIRMSIIGFSNLNGQVYGEINIDHLPHLLYHNNYVQILKYFGIKSKYFRFTDSELKNCRAYAGIGLNEFTVCLFSGYQEFINDNAEFHQFGGGVELNYYFKRVRSSVNVEAGYWGAYYNYSIATNTNFNDYFSTKLQYQRFGNIHLFDVRLIFCISRYYQKHKKEK